SFSRLQADKVWLNQNPFHTINIVAQQSPMPGFTDLVVDTVREDFPVRVHVTYDNTGVPVLGRDRWSLGVDIGSEYWLDHQISYQYTSNLPPWRVFGPQRPTYEAHSASWLAPLPWRDRLTVFGVYATAVPDLGPDLGL